MAEYALELRAIKAGYGNIEVLHDITLHVVPGEIVSVIGANGAGKSTLLRVVSGLINVRAGSILLYGQQIEKLAAHAIVAQGISHVPEGRRIFPRLTISENLRMGAFLVLEESVVRERMLEVEDLFPILAERRAQLAGTLSGGEQQMLAIGRALMSKPKVLVLDEPSMGVAPLVVEKIFLTLQHLNQLGMTMLLVEQNAYRALNLARRAYVLETGTIALEGLASELLNDERVQAAYLGA